MVMAQPHFLLFCDTHLQSPPRDSGAENHGVSNRSPGGRWHFVLEQLDGKQSSDGTRFEAADGEPATNQERLALWSVVRGLEALEQPSKVTLVTTSRYVSRGLKYGLSTWRDAEYKWERFGVQMPIRNADLWQRISVALNYHGVTCRLIQSSPHFFNNSPQGEHPAEETFAMAANTLAEDSPTLHGNNGANALNPPVAARDRTENAPKNWCFAWQDLWWKLATSWIKWWRGKLADRPALIGT